MPAYGDFAHVYDMFMDNVSYDQWTGYMISLLQKFGIRDGLVCELGCGTGEATERFAAAGYDMIGIDTSVEMLQEALEKKYESGHDILYLNQDMRSFELYGTVRAVVSIGDSMNYILEEEDLLQVFRLVNNYLDPGGMFLFDLKTSHLFGSIGDSVIAENREEGSMIWENSFDPESGLNEYRLTFFVPEEEEGGDGALYRRFDEVHVQRAYALSRIRELLTEAGLIFEGAWESFTDHAPGEDSDRIYVAAREHGKTVK